MGSLGTGPLGCRPAGAQRERLCLGHHRLRHGSLLGTVCLGAASLRKDPQLDGVLDHSVLLVTAGFAAAHPCTIGPPCAAGSWLAQHVLALDVFSRSSVGAQTAVGQGSAPAVQQL